MKKIPNPLSWHFSKDSLSRKRYIAELDHVHAHTDVDYLLLNPVDGVQLENLRQCHDVIREITEYAHSLGIRIGLRLSPGSEGFFNSPAFLSSDSTPEREQAEIFPLKHPEKAEAIVTEGEVTADETGFIRCEHIRKWARHKLPAVRPELLAAYAFRKTGDGFYDPDSLEDVTDRMRIIDSRTGKLTMEAELGSEYAGQTVYYMVAQYFCWYELFGMSIWEESIKPLMDAYADIPLDSMCFDEFGYLLLNASPISRGEEEPFRGRFYSRAQEAYYRDTLGLELKRLLLDMRYAPEGEPGVRIRAINRYFEELRRPPLEIEYKMADYAKKLFGEDVFLTCHNTFHNDLDNDEIWHTACNWWDLPRDFGHTDENITFPVRMGIMLAAKEPLMLDMFYSNKIEDYFRHIIEGAPFNCRDFHHALCDFYWGCSYFEPELYTNVQRLDRLIRHLNDFQTVPPKLDLLIVYGAAAQNNWYPEESARNEWDVNGKMKVLEKCETMWRAGYRCALVPDYAVEDGRITLSGDRILFCGHAFTHCLFLYPRYAKKSTYAFFRSAALSGVSLAAVGPADMDFDAEPAQWTGKRYDEFSLSILEDIGCPKSAIPEGSVYSDGSFAFVHYDGLMHGASVPVDLTLDGVRYTGVSTGILACRKGSPVLATPGGSLAADGVPLELDVISPDPLIASSDPA